MSKIIDCFTFFNELDILELRLTELNDIVDYFVLVEAKWTHSGKDKPFYFEQNKERYSKFLAKIIHVKVEDNKIPVYFRDAPNDHWRRENYQRYCIDKGLEKLDLKDEDLIIITDCDEIMDSDLLKKLKQNGLNGNYAPPLHTYFYNFNYKKTFQGYNKRPSIVDFKTYRKKYKRNPQTVRRDKNIKFLDCDFKGGWHLSYFGDIDHIITKIKSFSHQEFNNEHFTARDAVKERLQQGKYLFEGDKGQGDIPLDFIDLKDNDYLPKNYHLVKDLFVNC
jgi:beta-1,4-mannosyl-glycoprotein beta-1,4-N-acetylglucosaminyltransferase